jgi:hypothetical protein
MDHAPVYIMFYLIFWIKINRSLPLISTIITIVCSTYIQSWKAGGTHTNTQISMPCLYHLNLCVHHTSENYWEANGAHTKFQWYSSTHCCQVWVLRWHTSKTPNFQWQTLPSVWACVSTILSHIFVEDEHDGQSLPLACATSSLDR